MKKLFLLLLLGPAVMAQAQEEKPRLKDLLYSGKLKNSSGVVRQTDDLSTKIDTSTKRAPEPEQIVTAKVVTTQDTSVAKVASALPPDTSSVAAQSITNNTGNTSTEIAATTTEAAVVAVPVTAAAAPKSNTKLWKEYSDSLTSFLKAEAFPSKQIKKETYYMSFDYEIGTDGLVTVNTVSSTPSNNYLQAQVKQFLDNTPLKLNPVLDGSGQPKKTKRKQGFTVTKE
jgi:hypothetical protein